MSKFDKLLEKLLLGRSDPSFVFSDLLHLLDCLGFEKHVRGSHHIFTRDGVEEQLNLQKYQGTKHAKPYQVRQVRNLILKYGLGRGGNDDEV
ncbi:MAG: type II toxin-antitoxin system HicA family toxin [Longimicrobiaceae bacterium]